MNSQLIVTINPDILVTSQHFPSEWRHLIAFVCDLPSRMLLQQLPQKSQSILFDFSRWWWQLQCFRSSNRQWPLHHQNQYVKHHSLAIYLSKWHEVRNSFYIFIAWETSRSTATSLHYLVWTAKTILNLIFQCWFQRIPQYFATLPHALTNIYVICTVNIYLGRLSEISFSIIPYALTTRQNSLVEKQIDCKR